MNAREKLVPESGGPAKSVMDLGLCGTCNHVKLCLMYRDMKTRVVYCEEFEDSDPEPPRPARKTTRTTKKKADPGLDALREQVRGLCVNCEKLAVCTYPKPAGGVWHCEDYE